MNFRVITVFAFLLSLIPEVKAVNISGGFDGRIIAESDSNSEAVLEGVFLNARKVFRDRKGDRFIAIAQVDIDDNLDEIKPYQTYLQYKGPLGKWNIRVGIYTLPIGLLASYDTERLILQDIDPLSRGIKLDPGIQLHGFVGSFDYAISVSQGVGRKRLSDIDQNKLITARLAWQQEDITLGFSTIVGDVLLDKEQLYVTEVGTDRVYQKRISFDITTYLDALLLRSELLIGTDDDHTVGGGIVLADYAILPQLEINMKYAHWQRLGNLNFLGAGLSLNLHPGLFLRVANEYKFGKENINVFAIQAYYEFSRHF